MAILRLQVRLAFGIALEADLPEALVRSVASPRALLTQVSDGYLGDSSLSLWIEWSDTAKALDTDRG